MQLVIVITATLFIVCSTQAWSAAEQESVKISSASVPPGNPVVLNLRSKKNRLTFLQFQADALVKDENSVEIIKTHIPAIRHV